MKDPALLRHSKIRPSAQAVINHSYYLGQSLLMLSHSRSSDDDSDSLSGVNLVDDSDSDDDSESSDETELTYLGQRDPFAMSFILTIRTFDLG